MYKPPTLSEDLLESVHVEAGTPAEMYASAVSCLESRLDAIERAGMLCLGRGFSDRGAVLRGALSSFFSLKVRLEVSALVEYVEVPNVPVNELRGRLLTECARVVNEKLRLCLEEMPLLELRLEETHPLVEDLYEAVIIKISNEML